VLLTLREGITSSKKKIEGELIGVCNLMPIGNNGDPIYPGGLGNADKR
jgi:hypothetical protein